MYSVHVLLHISLFLFFWALSDFLHIFDATVGGVARGCFWALVVVYTVLSITPLVYGNSPYHTALTPPLRSGGMALLFLYRFIWRSLRGVPIWPLTRRQYFKGLRFDRTRFLLQEAEAEAAQLDPYAMEWLFTGNDALDDIDMDQFLGLQGYIRSPLTGGDHFPKVLTAEYILKRIKGHFMACAASLELSEEACMNRVQACVNSLQTIFKSSTEQTISKDAEGAQEEYIQEVIDGLNGLCDEADSKVALRASCVRSLAFQGLLTQLTESAGESPLTRRFPTHLVPLHTFFSLGGNTSGTQQDDSLNPPPEATSDQSQMAKNREMWRALLHDGPLVDLTLLAEAVVLHDGVDPSKLSFCWKTLELLLKGLGIARAEVSDSALAGFNHVHNKTRKRVRIQTEEQSSSLTPLLETLDAVARGQRLSVVFLRYHKYHGRADVVFGKEHLRNANLLQEFASCLPDFISVINHDESMKFMEDLVREDGLWTTLQDNLWNTLREDTPIPDKLSVFVACCTVLDQAFLALEGSQNVDWRAPEFGSLAQHLEMFVARCFQGTFVGRATSFRVGIVQARFCRALLAQFFNEVDRNGTVVFRSQWDVASLARLFYTLGVGGEADAEFWKSFVDGGHVGAGFMTKAHDMLKIAVRDGPLLNFCKLGRLAVTMVPFEGSDLNDLDVEKLLELLQSMVDDSRLPLKGASAEVWEDVSRLRDEVGHVISKSCDGDKVKLWPLFEKIEQAYELRPSASQESGPGDHLQAPGSETSAVVQPRLSSRELRPSRNRSSDASGPSSTVVASGRYEASPTKENDGGAVFRHFLRFPTDSDIFLEFAMYAHSDPRSTTLAYPYYSRNEDAIHYSASDPYRIGSGGAIAGPSAGAAYILPPVLGNTFLASQGISPVHPSFPHIRQNIQHRVVPVDIHPTRSPSTPPTPRSPRPGSLDPASAETASPSGHPNAVDGAQSGAPVIPEIYQTSE